MKTAESQISNLKGESGEAKNPLRREDAAPPPAGPGEEGAVGGVPWNGFTVRLWLPITQGRPHAAAVGDYATAFELARAKEGGGHHKDADFDVVLVVVEYPGRKAE